MQLGTRRLARGLALIGVAITSLTACQPVVVTVSGGGATACPQGTFHVTSQDVQALLDTVLGKLDVDALPGGTLTLTATATTWRLSGAQELSVAGPTPWGNVAGTVSATIDASGTYTRVTSSTLSFTLSSVAGSGTFTGRINGQPVTFSRSLADLGVDDIYGLKGEAGFACGTSPKLRLTFSSLTMDF